VNVLEDAENFKIEVAAPGLNKNDFRINLENNLITISCNKEMKHDEKDERYTRREFCFTSFQRTFTLPESIVGDKITAKYEDGVLSVVLPKREEARQKPAREISIN
jgi:HSP20 family protein